ncbi:hypothetical protein B0T10DRAFT_553575 [Thelonectria olida]|uniref:Uncharacterized protein n=1 Tax=Thelonectria olida TaxID=1576542 RepID=A0A9P8VPB9_9HYPO|nr:hypothetical protein B0T10DRAFT_553575 [Thelonectria olida]
MHYKQIKKKPNLNEFNEEEALKKILNFLIENNLSFNILNSSSFQELLNYYNKASPIMNRWKIKEDLLFKYTNLDIVYLNNNEPIEIEDNSNFNTIINRIRRISILIKYTTGNKLLLDEGIIKYKRENKLPTNKKVIPLDNSTRWNSTYYMLEATLELKLALVYIFNNTNNKEYKEIFLSD